MTYLLTSPDDFYVEYKINPWMEPGYDCIGATEEHKNLQLMLSHVILASPHETPTPPDFVFCANHAVVYNGKAILANFRHPQRQAELPFVRNYFTSLAWSGNIKTYMDFPDRLYFEGAGDCIWDKKRKLFWMGFGQRTEKHSQRTISDLFDVNVLAFELIDPRFYHLDLALSILYNGEVMYYPKAFSETALDMIEQLVAPKDRIILSERDALAFAANCISFSRSLCLLPYGFSDELSSELFKRNYFVKSVPVPTFQKAGGAIACMTLNLDAGKN